MTGGGIGGASGGGKGGRAEGGRAEGGRAEGGRDGGGGRPGDGFPIGAGRGSLGGAGPGGGDVPPGEPCASVADWAVEDSESELELYSLLNFARQYGIRCTADGSGESAPPVEMKPELRCAARLHARDMSERNFFDHVNPDGEGPEDRMRSAGATFRIAAESIAQGPSFDGTDPYEAFRELFSAGGDECENLLDPSFDSVGIGRYDDLWTLDFTGR
jgi:uncharacterized protein YkwD